MPTSKETVQKLQDFKEKDKFYPEKYPYSLYPGIADPAMRPVLTTKINQAADDFIQVAHDKNPTDKKYQDKIGLGLSRFFDVYLNLDTEDRERVCMYFEELMDIVGLESSDGQLNKFMYGFDINELKKNK